MICYVAAEGSDANRINRGIHIPNENIVFPGLLLRLKEEDVSTVLQEIDDASFLFPGRLIRGAKRNKFKAEPSSPLVHCG